MTSSNTSDILQSLLVIYTISEILLEVIGSFTKFASKTVQLLYMKRLIYLNNGQSLDFLVSPLKNDRP
jgi:hypothetical protein